MADVTAGMIKELRERTGVGMSKCKEALEQASGDMELAISNLRKAGMASAVKKEGRATNEGMIAVAESPTAIAVVEVNAETDFVVRNDLFQKFIKDIAEEVVKILPTSLEEFLKAPFSKDSQLTVDQYRATVVQAIGENIQIRRIKTFLKDAKHSIGVYSHLGGKIVTTVVIDGSSAEEALAKDIAMHVAAAAPDFLSPEKVPASVIENEQEIAKSQMQGKPANIVDKIVEGKVSSFFDAVCLVRQKYIRNDQLSIQQLVDEQAKKTGHKLVVSDFIRWNVGQ